MSALICECARCGEVLRVPVESLLVTVTAGSTDAARLAYICSSCNQFVDEALPLRGLSILLASACTPLVVTLTGERQ
jgi:hypothetical protein